MAVVETMDYRAEALEMVLSELEHDIDDGIDFITSEFEESRARAQRYYNGASDLPVDANRSQYVATKVRDTMRAVRPSLMRIFTSCAHPVEFVPGTVAQGMISEAQTKYITQLFDDLGGYKVIYDAFHSAMLFKLGVVKYWYDETVDPIYRKYTGLSEQHMMMLTAHPGVEVIAADEVITPGAQGLVRTFDVEIIGRKAGGEIEMKWVPLSEFVIDRSATCKEDARVIAHRANVPRGDLVAMGFDPELLEDLDGEDIEAHDFAEESRARRGYVVDFKRKKTQDESMQLVLLTEAYYRADIDGTGVPQLYRFYLGGTTYEMLDYERVDNVPFALFAIDPEPGTIFGKSLYDITEKEQDTMTSLTRATVDNFHMTNNPRLAVHEHMVNMDDVLNNDLGSPIRVRAAGQIQVIDTPFTGAAALPLLNHLNLDTEAKTGVTRASSGLDPDAMQSTDRDAVKNTIQMQQGQVELMARNLAETGMKDLFKGLLHLAMTHLDTNQILRGDGGIQPIQLDAFDPTMKTRVSVGLGTGSYEEKSMAYDMILALQKEAMATYGPGNPVVSLQQMQNTINDKLKLAGLHNPARYFGQVTPEQEKQLGEYMKQQSEKKEQTQKELAQMQMAGLAQAEQVKANAALQIAQGKGMIDVVKLKTQAEIDGATLQQKDDSDFRNLMVKDDLERDKLLQEMYLALLDLRADMQNANMIRQQQGMN